jgi:hypothetical protein
MLYEERTFKCYAKKHKKKQLVFSINAHLKTNQSTVKARMLLYLFLSSSSIKLNFNQFGKYHTNYKIVKQEVE